MRELLVALHQELGADLDVLLLCDSLPLRQLYLLLPDLQLVARLLQLLLHRVVPHAVDPRELAYRIRLLHLTQVLDDPW